jgi:uncharacterized protein involved in type VI secretion and phage assembly
MQIDLLNIIRREVQRFWLAAYQRKMVGYVDSYNPSDHTVKVKFPTELDSSGNPKISGWLPHAVTAGGAGASWVVGPQVGDQCVVEHLEGDPEAGHVTGYLHNTTDTPPNVASGEGVLRHTSTGNYLKMSSDGSIQTFHKSTGNYSKMDASGNFVTHLASTSQQHYLGGDPAAGGSFAPVGTTSGPSPYAQARYA